MCDYLTDNEINDMCKSVFSIDYFNLTSANKRFISAKLSGKSIHLLFHRYINNNELQSYINMPSNKCIIGIDYQHIKQSSKIHYHVWINKNYIENIIIDCADMRLYNILDKIDNIIKNYQRIM